MEQAFMLDIPFEFSGRKDSIHPALIVGEGALLLVDCGYTGFLPNLEAAISAAGFDCGSLTHVVITHQDHDHVGALAALVRKYPHIRVLAGESEVPYIDGTEKSLRLSQAEAMQALLPPEERTFGEAFCRLLRQVEPARVDLPLQDGDRLPGCPDTRVIATPGHTPGHISLYLEARRTVITGDAAVPENGVLTLANPRFTLDEKNARTSLEKLLALDPDTWICYHGGVFHKNKGR